jgi:hypothetical protein
LGDSIRLTVPFVHIEAQRLSITANSPDSKENLPND